MDAERLGDVCLGEVALKGFARWVWELDAPGARTNSEEAVRRLGKSGAFVGGQTGAPARLHHPGAGVLLCSLL